MARVRRAFALAAFLALLLTGCRSEETWIPEVPAAPTDSPAPDNFLVGSVVDPRGLPIEGVQLTLQELGKETTSTAEGHFLFQGLRPGRTFTVKAFRDGFSSSVRRITMPQDGPASIRFSLSPISTLSLPDAAVGGEVQTSDGLTLDFPAGAVVDASGQPVSGEVQVETLLIDEPDELSLAPGDMSALDPEGNGELQLESFGMIEVRLSQNGAPVQLASPVQIRFPLVRGAPFKRGDRVPLWSFDETLGLWRQEGHGTVEREGDRLYFTATATHFSWWNCDEPLSDKHCLEGRLVEKTSSGVTGVGGLYVEAIGEDYAGGSSAMSGADGRFCLNVKRGSSNTVVASGGTPQRMYSLEVIGVQSGTTPTECALGGCVTMGDLELTVSSDLDQDGWTDLEGDCDDRDSTIYPGGQETCDGVDQDCDGEIDETSSERLHFYPDQDGDGYGDQASPTPACKQPEGMLAVGGDCDDTRATANPGAAELCNALDDDCDGTIDEGFDAVWYRDADGDGIGDQEELERTCAPAVGYVASSGDCDDADPVVHPGAIERCNGLDDDCDLEADEDLTFSIYFPDDDGDGFGRTGAPPIEGCVAPAGYVGDDLDCDDTAPEVHPAAPDPDNGIDDNCNGQVDEDALACYPDHDSDHYGDTGAGISREACLAGELATGGDCQDTDPAIHPQAGELCDGLDNDCDGTIDDALGSSPYFPDADGDGFGDGDGSSVTACAAPPGYGTGATDCLDDPAAGGATVYPGAIERCDGLDQDCDGEVDEGVQAHVYLDADRDGFGAGEPLAGCEALEGYATNATDCDDSSPATNPGATEVCDGADNNCNGLVDEGVVPAWYPDGDGDGYGDSSRPVEGCEAPEGHADRGHDCDDTDPSIHPGPEQPDNGIDDNCNGLVDEPSAPRMAGGEDFSVVLREDDRLWSFGRNHKGQLGDGTLTSSSSPLLIPEIDDGLSVAAGYDHALLLRQDGRVMAWGGNSSGQIGNGTVVDQRWPVEVEGLEAIVAVSAGIGFSAALDAAGHVFAWGSNTGGQLGDGTVLTSSPRPVQVSGISGVVAIATGTAHTLALTADGKVFGWGQNYYGQVSSSPADHVVVPTEIPGLEPIIAIAAGERHSLALSAHGRVFFWGEDASLDALDPVPPTEIPELEAVVAIDAGDYFSAALTAAGELWVWGSNDHGEQGDGSFGADEPPSPVPAIDPITAFSAGSEHLLARTMAGEIVAWGDGASGQLGNHEQGGRQRPAPVGFDDDGDGWSRYEGDCEDGDPTIHPAALEACDGRDGDCDGRIDPAFRDRDGDGFGDPAAPITSCAAGSILLIDATDCDDGDASIHPGPEQRGDGVDDNCNGEIDEPAWTAAVGNFWHTLALRADGTVRAWGDNTWGQLGDGTNTDRAAPVRVAELETITRIEAGDYHSLAVRTDGTVWAWGLNSGGQLGDATRTSRTTPVRVVGIEAVVAVTAGAYHSVALTTDGAVWTWGHNEEGQLGDGTVASRSVPRPVPGLEPVVDIAATSDFTLAVTRDGRVYGWGHDYYGRVLPGPEGDVYQPDPIEVPGLAEVEAIAVGGSFALALHRDGTVSSWGSNGSGQLGNGTTSARPQPGPVSGLSNIVSIAAGEYHGMAMGSDGSLRVWGANGDGQLANGTNLSNPWPAAVPNLEAVSRIGTGDRMGLAVSAEGALLSWGYNRDGQLGDGSAPNSRYAVGRVLLDEDADGVTTTAGDCDDEDEAVYPGAMERCNGIDDDCNGGIDDRYADADGDGFGDPARVQSPCTGASGFVQDRRDCDDRDAKVHPGWETAGDGRDDNCNGLTDEPRWLQVSGGIRHSLALAADGSVWAWGANWYGERGDEAGGNRTTPARIEGLEQIVAIVAGDYFSLALDLSGRVWAWGYGGAGSLGNGTLTSASRPAPVPGLESIVAIAAGYEHCLALEADGTLYSWGSNFAGQLGHGGTIRTLLPYPVAGLEDATAIAAGYDHSLAVRADGTVWAWGDNEYGQIGDGTWWNVRTWPVQVVGLTGATTVAAGGSNTTVHSMALREDGTVWAWGSNEEGQLGDGTTAYRATPTRVKGLSAVVDIEVGIRHSLALEEDGSIFAWGDNNFGQLGDGSTTDRLEPVRTATITDGYALSAGGTYSLAVTDESTGWGWGTNYYGELGSGNTTSSATPVTALLPATP